MPLRQARWYLKGSVKVGPRRKVTEHTVAIEKLQGIGLWDLQNPKLYHARVTLQQGALTLDQDTRRFGFREAVFTQEGFHLNGKVIKLRGLDRHQTFPFVGQAMSGRAQRRDAQIVRQVLRCNIVRTSHSAVASFSRRLR